MAQTFNLIWMQGQTDDGDSMSVINSKDPDFLSFLENNNINLLYHPTLSPQFGPEAQALFKKCLSGEIPVHLFCFEGSIPTKAGFGDFFEMQDVREMVKNFANKAMLTIAVGTCAAYGGIPAAPPNETGATGMQFQFYEKGGFLGVDYVSGVGLPVVNIPGCPTHPDWVIGTLTSFILGRPILLDKYSRPIDYFGEKVHRGCLKCEYMEQFLWAKDFTELGCLAASLGCKGRTTNADCNARLWNGTSSCTRAGHPCIGCCDPGFPVSMLPFNKETVDISADVRAEQIERNKVNKGGELQ